MRTLILCAMILMGTCTYTLQAKGDKKQADIYATHPWYGKRIAYIGDSVTDPHQGGGQVTHYWQFLSDWLHSTPLVYAVSGYDWTHAIGLTDKLHKEVGQDVDAIIVFLGTNDYNGDLPLGNWFTEKAEHVQRGKGGKDFEDVRLHRTLSMDQGTLRGQNQCGHETSEGALPHQADCIAHSPASWICLLWERESSAQRGLSE